jgi:hypothetical protein
VRLGIEPIAGNIGLHGLRRTYASLRAAAGDDVAYTAEQLGHTDPAFALRVYTHAVKRRQRLAGLKLEQFNARSNGPNGHKRAQMAPARSRQRSLRRHSPIEKPRVSGAFLRWAVLGSNQ